MAIGCYTSLWGSLRKDLVAAFDLAIECYQRALALVLRAAAGGFAPRVCRKVHSLFLFVVHDPILDLNLDLCSTGRICVMVGIFLPFVDNHLTRPPTYVVALFGSINIYSVFSSKVIALVPQTRGKDPSPDLANIHHTIDQVLALKKVLPPNTPQHTPTHASAISH